MTVKQIIDDVFNTWFGYPNENGDRFYNGCVITAYEVRLETEIKIRCRIKQECSNRRKSGAPVATKFKKLGYSNDAYILYDNNINLETYLIGTCMETTRILMDIAYSAVRYAAEDIEVSTRYRKEQKAITEHLKEERIERRKHLKEENDEWDYLRFSKTGTDNYISVSGVNDAINEYLSTKDW
jgi:hypothetical protein